MRFIDINKWAKTPLRFCLLLLTAGILYSGVFHGLNKSYLYVFSDARAYFTTGKNLAHGFSYTEGERSKWRDAINRVCPLYIASLAGIFTLLPDSEPWYGQDKAQVWEVLVILLYQTLCYALGACLVYLIGRRIWDERLGRWAGLGAVFIPDFMVWAGMVVSEPLFMVLFLAGVLALTVYFEERSRWGLAVLAFLFLGLSTLVRPNILLPTLILAGWFAFTRRWKEAAAGLVVFLLVLTPFTVRNMIKHDRMWYATSTAYLNFYVGNQVGSTGEIIWDDDDLSLQLGIDYNSADAVELTDALKPALKKLILEHPWHLVKINLLKGLRFFTIARTTANSWIHNNNRYVCLVHLAVNMTTNAWLFILGPWGLLLIGQRTTERRMMLFFSVLLSLAGSAMYIQARHRFVYFPFFLFGAVALTRHLWTQWRPRLKELGLKGLWGSLDRVQRRIVFWFAVWTAYVFGGTLVDGLMRFERFLNFLSGTNRYL